MAIDKNTRRVQVGPYLFVGFEDDEEIKKAAEMFRIHDEKQEAERQRRAEEAKIEAQKLKVAREQRLAEDESALYELKKQMAFLTIERVSLEFTINQTREILGLPPTLPPYARFADDPFFPVKREWLYERKVLDNIKRSKQFGSDTYLPPYRFVQYKTAEDLKKIAEQIEAEGCRIDFGHVRCVSKKNPKSHAISESAFGGFTCNDGWEMDEMSAVETWCDYLSYLRWCAGE